MMNHSQYLTIAAVVILAVSVVFVYTTTSNEIASLKQAGETLCTQNQQAGVALGVFAENLTLTLQRQVQNDKSIINSLNSTRPSGYQDAIALINGQINQDNSLVAFITSQFHQTSLPPPSDVCYNTFAR